MTEELFRKGLFADQDHPLATETDRIRSNKRMQTDLAYGQAADGNVLQDCTAGWLVEDSKTNSQA